MVGVIRETNLDWAEETRDGVQGNQFGDYRAVEVKKRMTKESGSGKGIKGLEARDSQKAESTRDWEFNGRTEETFIQGTW